MYGRSIGIQTGNLGELILQLKRGLPVGSLTRLGQQLDVSESRLATTDSIAQRTLTR